MQDILIPNAKRISYFFGWDDRSPNPPKDEDVKSGVLRHFWMVAKVTQHIASWVGVHTMGRGLSIGCDFDILCYVFDKDKKLIEIVAPGHRKEVNENGSIYHSGDNDGLGGFDEELSMELSKIPPAAHTIIVYIRNDSDHGVSPHVNAHLKLMNMTDSVDYFTHDISFAGHNEHGFIVSRLTKLGSSWRHDFIDEYSFAHPDGKEAEFFAPFLKG